MLNKLVDVAQNSSKRLRGLAVPALPNPSEENASLIGGVGKIFQKILEITTDEVEEEKGAEFDMAYITPRLIALGRPWDQPSSHANNANNAEKLGEYLIEEHAGRFLLWNLSGEKLDPVDSRKLTDQVLDPEWNYPENKTNIPCIDKILKICYSIQAWFDVDEDYAVAGIFCANGIVRTGILIACYLRFSEEVESTIKGFEMFCVKRMKKGQAPDISKLPPYLFNFFGNFDATLQSLTYPNEVPLCLRGVAIAGVPVQTLPEMDVWNLKNKIYSSTEADAVTKDWKNSEGFYRINQVLHGDFAIRFYLRQDDGRETKLFKYMNSTLFIPEGVLKLYKKEVDIVSEFKEDFDEADFQLSLLFSVAEKEELSCASLTSPDVKIFPPFSEASTRAGLCDISSWHTLSPIPKLLDILLEKGHHLEASNLALQLSCNDVEEALEMLPVLEKLLPSSRQSNQSDQGSTDVTQMFVDGEEEFQTRITGLFSILEHYDPSTRVSCSPRSKKQPRWIATEGNRGRKSERAYWRTADPSPYGSVPPPSSFCAKDMLKRGTEQLQVFILAVTNRFFPILTCETKKYIHR